ncbi:MAG: hypothetical protein K6F64_03980 [Clostridia bacterium]|nr:hypothetical protein [Clostridia bacterium]
MARKRKESKLAVPVGILTIILAVIGLITVIHGVAGIVEDRKNNVAEKEKYEELLTPVVMFDPDPFDDLTQADKSQLLYAAIWDLLLDKDGTSKYSYSQGENIGIVVPQNDIKTHFIKLFSDEIDIDSLYNEIDMSGYDITYDAALQSYILPITGVDFAYVPEIYNLEKQGNSTVLEVGYIGNKAWADIKSDEYTAPEADKVMKITLRERNGEIFVSSIQETDSTDIADITAENRNYLDENTENYENGEVITEEITEPVSAEDITGESLTDENGETVTGETETEPGESETVNSEETEEIY